jgi:hypothetical protein
MYPLSSIIMSRAPARAAASPGAGFWPITRSRAGFRQSRRKRPQTPCFGGSSQGGTVPRAAGAHKLEHRVQHVAREIVRGRPPRCRRRHACRGSAAATCPAPLPRPVFPSRRVAPGLRLRRPGCIPVRLSAIRGFQPEGALDFCRERVKSCLNFAENRDIPTETVRLLRGAS